MSDQSKPGVISGQAFQVTLDFDTPFQPNPAAQQVYVVIGKKHLATLLTTLIDLHSQNRNPHRPYDAFQQAQAISVADLVGPTTTANLKRLGVFWWSSPGLNYSPDDAVVYRWRHPATPRQLENNRIVWRPTRTTRGDVYS